VKTKPIFEPVLLGLLAEAGMTKSAFARKIGITTQGVQRWKKGWPDSETLQKIAAELRVPLERLMPPGAQPASRVEHDLFVSLGEFLEVESSSVTDDERAHLLALARITAASDGDPGYAYWHKSLKAYRERDRAPKIPDRRADLSSTDSKGDVIPLKPKPPKR
jgi:transcriptional regulator with XRE-family HTH domain